MRNHTLEIYNILSKGNFICIDSVKSSIRSLYNDLSDNFSEYQEYFKDLGLTIDAGDGYFVFAREDSRTEMENKLKKIARWVDLLDFLKTYDANFGPGYQFRTSQIQEKVSRDLELGDKAGKLYPGKDTNRQITDELIKELGKWGFVENVNEREGTCKVTSAFNYAMNFVDVISVYSEGATENNDAYKEES